MEYFAFISYSHKDRESALWFQKELENYHLPSHLSDNCKLPKEFRPVFRDEDELSAGELTPQICEALEGSLHLVVVCSPNSAHSDWVDTEINYFISLRPDNKKQIFPFIIDGVPRSKDGIECYPQKLRELTMTEDILGGNVKSEGGREKAFIRILAGMTCIPFSILWNQYERDIKERKEKFGRIIGDKALDLINEGDSHLAAALIMEMHRNESGIITPEVEKVLRMALIKESSIIKDDESVLYVAISPNGKLLATISSTHETISTPFVPNASACSLKVWNYGNGKLIDKLLIPNIEGEKKVQFIADGEKIIHSSYLGFTTRNTHNLKEEILPKWHWERPKVLKHKPYYKDFIVDPNERFAVVGLNWGIYIIDLKTNEELCNIDDKSIPSFGKHMLSSLSISPNNEVLFSFYNSDEIWLWNWQESKCYNILTCQCKYIQFSNNGKSLLIAYENGPIDIRNSEQPYNLISRVTDNSNVYAFFNFSLDDKQVLLGEKAIERKRKCAVYVYDIASGTKESVSINDEDVNCIVQNKSGNQIISASKDRTIRILNIGKQRSIAEKLITDCKKIIYFPNGETIITATIKRPYLTLQFRDALSLEKKPIGDHKLIAWHIDSMTISPDGKILFLTDEFNHKAYLIDLVHFRDELYQGNRNENFVGIAYKSEDDVSFRIFRNENKDSIIVKSANGSIIKEIEISHAFKGYSVDPQCRFLSVRSPEGSITIHTLEYSIENVSLSKAPHYGEMCFSPDGKFFIGPYDKYTLGVWETDTWKLLHNRIQVDNPHIDCSPDSKYLIGCSNSKEISIWDISSGIAVDSIMVEEHVASVKFNPYNGQSTRKSFAVLLNDGTLSIYPWLSVDELIDNAKERYADRKLSDEEKAKYYL